MIGFCLANLSDRVDTLEVTLLDSGQPLNPPVSFIQLLLDLCTCTPASTLLHKAIAAAAAAPGVKNVAAIRSTAAAVFAAHRPSLPELLREKSELTALYVPSPTLPIFASWICLSSNSSVANSASFYSLTRWYSSVSSLVSFPCILIVSSRSLFTIWPACVWETGAGEATFIPLVIATVMSGLAIRADSGFCIYAASLFGNQLTLLPRLSRYQEVLFESGHCAVFSYHSRPWRLIGQCSSKRIMKIPRNALAMMMYSCIFSTTDPLSPDSEELNANNTLRAT